MIVTPQQADSRMDVTPQQADPRMIVTHKTTKTFYYKIADSRALQRKTNKQKTQHIHLLERRARNSQSTFTHSV